jgi:hypothetical protein
MIARLRPITAWPQFVAADRLGAHCLAGRAMVVSPFRNNLHWINDQLGNSRSARHYVPRELLVRASEGIE